MTTIYKGRRNKRLRNKIKRRFQAKTIDYAKYMRDFYIENNIAFISCNVDNYYDVINPYSVNDYEWLNDSFAAYIESNAYYIPSTYPIIIEICSNTFTDEEKKTIESTIIDYYCLKLGDKQLDIQSNLSMIITTAIMSIIVLLISVVLRRIFTFWAILETSNIFFWIFLWRLFDLVIERLDLYEQKAEAGQLASVKIKFSNNFVDGTIDIEKAEKVIDDILNK